MNVCWQFACILICGAVVNAANNNNNNNNNNLIVNDFSTLSLRLDRLEKTLLTFLSQMKADASNKEKTLNGQLQLQQSASQASIDALRLSINNANKKTGDSIELLRRQMNERFDKLEQCLNCSKPTKKRVCPSQSFDSGEGCYRFEPSQAAEWFTAQSRCIQDGGKILAIESEGEWKALVALMANKGVDNRSLWTAGTDYLSPGTWKWGIPGEKMTYTSWSPNQPLKVTSTGTTCVALSADKERTWFLATCDHKFGFVCEYKVLSEDGTGVN